MAPIGVERGALSSGGQSVSQQVTLDLPSELVGRAERQATLRGTTTQDVLTDALSDALAAKEGGDLMATPRPIVMVSSTVYYQQK